MTHTFKSLLGLVVVGALSAGIAATAAEEKPAEKSSATKATKSRGGATDENIKAVFKSNSTSNPTPAPAAKGGEKERGTCRLVVDNRTPLFIEIYVEGYFQGTVGPWGDIWGYFPSGRRTVFARAVFDDGSVLNWGPVGVPCYGEYVWRLDN